MIGESLKADGSQHPRRRRDQIGYACCVPPPGINQSRYRGRTIAGKRPAAGRQLRIRSATRVAHAACELQALSAHSIRRGRRQPLMYQTPPVAGDRGFSAGALSTVSRCCLTPRSVRRPNLGVLRAFWRSGHERWSVSESRRCRHRFAGPWHLGRVVRRGSQPCSRYRRTPARLPG
jgi:hypothetical protein